ncbi:MAG: DUF881 domain-containing protein [Actinomycetota bacterium]|nr:DUF881 domain-containing protein [Actinomycetota bacterium]
MTVPASLPPPSRQPPAARTAGDTRGRGRLLRALIRPRAGRGHVVAAVLCGLLGFAAVAQVRSTQEGGLSGLRQSELIGILDNVSERSERLAAEQRELERAREQLTTGGGRDRAALEEAHERAETLGILAGTVPAHGPGIEVTIPDPNGEVRAEALLDAVQELRDAGAEAIAIGAVRVVASTYFTDTEDGVEVDGTPLASPYLLQAIGDPQTLASSLAIPGGVQERLAQDYGITAQVTQRDDVEVVALRAPEAPQYARPAPEATGGG